MKGLRPLLKKHAAKETKLKMQMFWPDGYEEGEEEPSPRQEYVLIEGDNDSIRFLGQLLIAHASGNFGCSLDLHPTGPGCAHFTPSSTVGLYVHTKPCEDK